MSERDIEKIIALLEELRDGQKLQLHRQAEAIAQQKERLATLDQTKAAAENIQHQSANTLRKSEQLINRARFMSVFVVPLALVLLVVVCWLAFHRAAP
jgi:uncharacterized membrane protein YdfJ with MMPL/SSD domain